MQTITSAEKLLRNWMAEQTPAALAIYASGQVAGIREQVLDTYAEKRFIFAYPGTTVHDRVKYVARGREKTPVKRLPCFSLTGDFTQMHLRHWNLKPSRCLH